MSEILYPFMPPDRSFRFVTAQDVFMKEAKLAYEEQAGDRLFPVGAVLVKDGQVLARAGNGFNKGRQQIHVCPRIVQECPSGTGYDLCNLHDSPGHAEAMLMQVATEQGIDPSGCDVYLYGHWWCCEPCWNAMIQEGIRDVYLLENAHEEFDRDRVYAKTLQSSAKHLYVAGSYVNGGGLEVFEPLFQMVAEKCAQGGFEVVIPFRDYPGRSTKTKDFDVSGLHKWTKEQIELSDVLIAEVSYPSFGVGGELMLAEMFQKPIVLLSKKGNVVSDFATGNPLVVYHICYETFEEVERQLQNVLKQL